MLLGTDEPLLPGHDLVLFDLDGVLYVSGEALPGGADAVAQVRAAGAAVGFLTNNASRTPEAVAQRLTRMGITAGADEVVTSAQAAARLLAGEHPPGSAVVVLGDEGLRQAVARAGLRAVGADHPDPVAAVTGFAEDVRWREVMDVAVLIRSGVPWTACNEDRTIPTTRGPAPGHGTQVRMLSDFAGVRPRVAGKPRLPLFIESVRRLGGSRPLMVGDRLDTDIEGARAAEMRSLLVLTGVTGLTELVAATPEQRPSHLAVTLRSLTRAHPPPEVAGPSGGADHHAGPTPPVRLRGWSAHVRDHVLQVRGAGRPEDWWRCVATAAWLHQDRTGHVPDAVGLCPPESDGTGSLDP